MKTFRLVVIGVCMLLLGLWFYRVISLNIKTEKQKTVVYNIGETVSYGSNYNYSLNEAMNGYEIEALSANVFSYIDYLDRMNLSTDDLEEWHPNFLFVVEIKVINHDNPSEIGGTIDLIDTYLASKDTRLAVDNKLMGRLYPQLGDSPSGFRIRPGTEMILQIPYEMERISWLYVSDEELFLRGSVFYLNVTQYPIKQVIQLEDGAHCN